MDGRKLRSSSPGLLPHKATDKLKATSLHTNNKESSLSSLLGNISVEVCLYVSLSLFVCIIGAVCMYHRCCLYVSLVLFVCIVGAVCMYHRCFFDVSFVYDIPILVKTHLVLMHFQRKPMAHTEIFFPPFCFLLRRFKINSSKDAEYLCLVVLEFCFTFHSSSLSTCLDWVSLWLMECLKRWCMCASR